MLAHLCRTLNKQDFKSRFSSLLSNQRLCKDADLVLPVCSFYFTHRLSQESVGRVKSKVNSLHYEHPLFLQLKICALVLTA